MTLKLQLSILWKSLVIYIDSLNYKRTGTTSNKMFCKNLLNSAWLWNRGRITANKKPKYISLPHHQLAENVILVFGFYKRKTNTWKQICSYICWSYNYNYSYKNICQIASKMCSFIDHLSHKTINRLICSMPLLNLLQLKARKLKSFSAAFFFLFFFF